MKTKEEILKSVKQDGRALNFASDGLRNDNEIIIAASEQYITNIKNFIEQFKIEQDPHSLNSLKNLMLRTCE